MMLFPDARGVCAAGPSPRGEQGASADKACR